MRNKFFTRSLFVAFCAFFVCVSALAGDLNPFAFKLSSTLQGDVFTVTYYLNAPATNVDVIVDIDNDGVDAGDVVYNCNAVKNTQGTTLKKGIYTAAISLREEINNLAAFRGKNNLRWYVDVKGGNQEEYPAVGGGQTLAAKEVTSYSYNFYNPISVDIDVDPYSDNFGVIYMVERIDGVANAITGVNNISSYYGWHQDDGGQYKGGLYSFDPAFQNLPTMYNQVGAGKAYDYVNYDINKIKAARRDASMNANSSGHQGGTFNKNYLFGRVRIAYKDDHKNRVFMTFSPYKQTSGDKALILGEVRTENYPLIGRVAGGGTGWFDAIIKANTYVEGSKVGCYNGDKFVAGPNIIFDASINNGYLSLLMVSGKYLDRENTSREAFRCDEYKIDKNASTISGPHKAQIFNLRKNENANDVNYWYSNDRKLVPDCLGNIPNTDVKAHPQGSTCKYCVGAPAVGFSNTYNLRGIEYDPDGKGFWHVQTRDNHNEIPSMVHFRYNEKSTQYEVNFAEYICARGGGGVRYDITADRLAVSGGKFSTKTYTKAGMTTDAHRTKNVWPSGITDNFQKPAVENDWATIYTINKAGLKADMIDNYTDQSKKDYKETSVENKKKVFTDSVLINVGARSDDFAWDYADNLYIASTSAHKFFAFALPHKDKVVSTPCKQGYYFNTPASELYITITPNNVNCGEVVDLDFQKRFTYYMDGAKYKLEAKAADGYRFFSWLESKTTHNPQTTQYRTMPGENQMRANFGIEVYESQSVTPVNTTMTSGDYVEFTGVWVRRALDDVSYSTICLPFDLTSLVGTPYAGATVLKLVDSEAKNEDGDNRVFLNFAQVSFEGDDYMHGGVPYLIQLKSDQTTTATDDLIFNDVRCPKFTTTPNTHGGLDVDGGNGITFHGMLNPATFTKAEIQDKLFLTADNRLVTLYGQNSVNINGLRGYFTVSGGMAKTAEFVLNLPEKVVTSTPMVNMADSLQVTKYLWDGKIYIQRGNAVYDLSGARVK